MLLPCLASNSLPLAKSRNPSPLVNIFSMQPLLIEEYWYMMPIKAGSYP